MDEPESAGVWEDSSSSESPVVNAKSPKSPKSSAGLVASGEVASRFSAVGSTATDASCVERSEERVRINCKRRSTSESACAT